MVEYQDFGDIKEDVNYSEDLVKERGFRDYTDRDCKKRILSITLPLIIY